jgi:hypothetical protein
MATRDVRVLLQRFLDALALRDASLLQTLVAKFTAPEPSKPRRMQPTAMARVVDTFREHAQSGRSKDVESAFLELVAKVRHAWGGVEWLRS